MTAAWWRVSWFGHDHWTPSTFDVASSRSVKSSLLRHAIDALDVRVKEIYFMIADIPCPLVLASSQDLLHELPYLKLHVDNFASPVFPLVRLTVQASVQGCAHTLLANSTTLTPTVRPPARN
jgi:hypothetical protein